MGNNSNLIERLDFAFSKFIRQRGMDEFGVNKCFLCPKRLMWRLLTCGHFRKRRHMATRFDETNCEPLCVECNGIDDEELFARKLDEKHGKGTADRLVIKSHAYQPMSQDQMKKKINHYESINQV